MPLFFVILFYLSSITPTLGAETSLLTLSNSPEWRALLHYFDEDTSEIKRGAFFLSPDGHLDPLAELSETIKAFEVNRTVGPLHAPASCAFPARRLFLEKHGFRVNQVACPDWDRFFKEINPIGLTLVFSTAYANNPASMFGHTLIKIRSEGGDPLLNYGLNYSAETKDGEAGLFYIFKGIFGLYQGRFQFAPYFQKVLEYTEAESRDLWEYDLNFSKEETVFWLAHAYELRFLANFQYTFFYGNCSYQIAQSLRVVRPNNGNWIPAFSFYVMPGDTIRALKDSNLSLQLEKEVGFRASHYRILRHRYFGLSSDEKERFHLIKDDLTLLSKLNRLQDVKISEALHSYYEFIKLKEEDAPSPSTESALRAIRLNRARMGGVSAASPVITASNRPDSAHAPRMSALSYEMSRERGPSLILGTRLGVHDLLDRDDGFEPNFGIEGLKFDLAFRGRDQRVDLHQVLLIKIESFEPMNALVHPLSWKIDLGFIPILNNMVFNPQVGVGATLGELDNKLLLNLLIRGSAQVDDEIDQKEFYLMGAEANVILRFSSWAKVRVSSVFDYAHFARKSFFGQNLEMAFSEQSREWRLQVNQNQNELKGGISHRWFY